MNGALGNVAGVVNEAGNVMGLMPHPEHAVDPLLGSADGGLLLAALVDAAAAHSLRSRRVTPRRYAPRRRQGRAAKRSQHLPEDGRALERRPQSLEIARPHRDGPAACRPVGRVREADEALAARRLEELDDDREALVADALREPIASSTSSAVPHGVAAVGAFAGVLPVAGRHRRAYGRPKVTRGPRLRAESVTT